MARFEEKLRCTKEPYVEEGGQRRIKSILFSTLSGEEIQKSAEVQVWKSYIYDVNKKPVENGLLDQRMGAANKLLQCTTCHARYSDCPGHFGYLKLALPVYNIGFFNKDLDILKCICKNCSRILLADKVRREFLRQMRSPNADATKKMMIVRRIRDKCKIARCPWCGHVNGTVKKKSPLSIIHDFPNGLDVNMKELREANLLHKRDKFACTPIPVIDPQKVLSLFRRMIAEDCELLGLSSRPENLMVTTLAIPPATIRPSSIVGTSNSSSHEDSITGILQDLMYANSKLRELLEKGESQYTIDTHWAYLQIKVVEYINGECTAVPEPKKRGLVQRLKGKQGRFRGTLSGKRVEYTGRTVISPDPNLKINEVAIPVLMAKVLTYPERVSNHNIEKLRERVRNGPTKHPGANYITLPDDTKLNLKFANRKIAANELKLGCIVERHLEDGDAVLFNRQPSLHRMSIMCHRARIRPWRTLRFNESVCNPYNADFDGDEMNVHVPQTEEARTEALMLMGVQDNLCTPKNGEILVASTQDFLTTSFLITRKDTFYDRATFSLLCSYLGDSMEAIDLPSPALIKPIELWTGKQLFSVLVRPNAQTRVFLNLTVKEKIYVKRDERMIPADETMCPTDGWVYFRNSELICGQLGKATLGNGNKDGLYSVLLRDYNAHAAASCMNRLAKLSARFIGNHGFSIGIDDIEPGERLNEQKKMKIDKGYRECNELIASYSKSKLTLNPGCNAAQTLEYSITGVLNPIREDAAKVCMAELHWRNSPLIMSQCGSKGNPNNISQMVACVGQQDVGGKRPSDGFIDRTLPHFPVNSKTPAAKGFVANSFYTGLTPTEFFFHTMSGREGLIDTAVKTAETGYMSRRLMKGLEDLAVYYDQTVRNASGQIVQFLYGGDGMDPAKMEGKDGAPLNLDQLFMKVMATCPLRDQGVLSSSEILKITKERLLIFLGDQGVSSPSEVLKITEEGKLLCVLSPEGGCSAGFVNLISDFVNNRVTLWRNTRETLNLDEGSVEKINSGPVERVAANISGISVKQLQVFLETCISRYQLKKVEAGAVIGPIGAQSIGEPGTQMTLKTFHFAGVASMNITLGVPRLKELIDATKTIRTPVIKAKLLPINEIEKNELLGHILESLIEKAEFLQGKEIDKKELWARYVKSSIEKTDLGQVAKSMKVVLGSGQPCVVVRLDMKLIESLHIGISAETVQQSILMHPKIKLNAEHVKVVRNDKLRVYAPEVDRSKLQYVLHTIKSMLPKVVVKGIPTVERAFINKGKDNKEEKYGLEIAGTRSKQRSTNQLFSNLLAVMGTPGINARETTSNHVMEVQHTLGIEAARQCIINEINVTMRSHGMSIDIRHLMLLADLMTYKGEVLGVQRFDLAKMKDSVLMLASFERTDEILFNASYGGREEQVKGVTECIIMGMPMLVGTGMFKIRQRMESIPEFKYEPDPIMS